MNKKQRYFIYGFFAIVYVSFGVFNYLNSSQWLLDNVLSLFFLTAFFLLAKWLHVGKVSFILFNVALLSHNLGAFGLYSISWGIFGYDNVVHFLSSFVAAYIVFNFIAYKLHVKQHKKSTFDDHVPVLILLVISLVAMMGVLIEVMEFIGYTYLGAGDGIFFVGAGDSGDEADVTGQYVDTMSDILVNAAGTLLGVLVYYHFRYRKRPWLKYMR